jgi:hypothetical protein
MVKDAGKKKERAGKDEPTPEELQVAAYYRWLEREREGQPGSDTGDWLEAENKWRDNIVPSRND